MAIPQSFIQELLARADVVEIVGRYVQLKKGGANFMGLCPFHGEKSPSFTVSPAKQFYHCFGCGKNGNAIGFLMDHAGMTFIEAVKDLAGQFGMVVPEEQQSPEDRAKAAAQKALDGAQAAKDKATAEADQAAKAAADKAAAEQAERDRVARETEAKMQALVAQRRQRLAELVIEKLEEQREAADRDITAELRAKE